MSIGRRRCPTVRKRWLIVRRTAPHVGRRQLLDTVQQALDQDRVARAQNAEREELRKRFESLTPGEVAVMRLVVAGLLNKQMMKKLKECGGGGRN